MNHTAFFRLDRGNDKVDHHIFFLFEGMFALTFVDGALGPPGVPGLTGHQGPKFHVHHTSYETFDFDTQVLGHDWLRDKGYTNCWGVGRHVMGSQIFDYWYVPQDDFGRGSWLC